MAKTTNLVRNSLAVAGSIALIGLLAKGAADKIIENIVVVPGSPQLDSTPFYSGFIRTDVPVTITNNNLFPIGLKYFKGVVSFGEVDLADISINTPFSVPSGGTLTITLNMDVPIGEVILDIGNLIIGGNVFDVILNKLLLNGSLQVQGNFTNIPIPLENIAIPLV
jgi:LEA14-like dessication related protein